MAWGCGRGWWCWPRPRPPRAPCYPLGGRPARAAHRMRSWAGGVLPAGGVAAPGNPVRPGGAVPGRLPRGRERERCQGASGVSRTNHGSDEVRYEHLASGRDSAVTPRPMGPQWRTRSSVARESSAPQNTTKTMSCMAFPPMLVLTVVCSMLDNRVLAHRPTASHLGPNTPAPPAVRDHTVTTLVLRPSVPLADRH